MSDQSSSKDQQAAGQINHDLGLVYAAMMEELGNGRMDTLPLEDGKLRDHFKEEPSHLQNSLLQKNVHTGDTAAWYNLKDESAKEQPQSEADGQLYRIRAMTKQQKELPPKPEPSVPMTIEELRAFNSTLTPAGTKSRISSRGARGARGARGGRGGRGGGSSSRGGHSSVPVRNTFEIIGHHLGGPHNSNSSLRGNSYRGARGSPRSGDSTRRGTIEAAISRLSSYHPRKPSTPKAKQPAISKDIIASAKLAPSWNLASPEEFFQSAGVDTSSKTTTQASDVARPGTSIGLSKTPAIAATSKVPIQGFPKAGDGAPSKITVPALGAARPSTLIGPSKTPAIVNTSNGPSKPSQGLASSRYADAVPSATSQAADAPAISESAAVAQREIVASDEQQRKVMFNHTAKVGKEGGPYVLGDVRIVAKSNRDRLTLEVEAQDRIIINELLVQGVLFSQSSHSNCVIVFKPNALESWLIEFRVPYAAATAQNLVESYGTQESRPSSPNMYDRFPEDEDLVSIASSVDGSQESVRGQNWDDMNAISNGPALISLSDDGRSAAPEQENVMNQTYQDLAPLMATEDFIDMILDWAGGDGQFLSQVDKLVAMDPEASKDPALEAKYKRVLTDGLQSSVWSDGASMPKEQVAATAAIVAGYLDQGQGHVTQSLSNLWPDFPELVAQTVYEKVLEKSRLPETPEKPENTVALQVQNEVRGTDLSSRTGNNVDDGLDQAQFFEDLRTPTKSHGPLTTIPQASAAGTHIVYSAEEILSFRSKARLQMEGALAQPSTQNVSGSGSYTLSSPSPSSSESDHHPRMGNDIPKVVGVNTKKKPDSPKEATSSVTRASLLIQEKYSQSNIAEPEQPPKPIRTYLFDGKDKAKAQKVTKEDTIPLRGGLASSRWAQKSPESKDLTLRRAPIGPGPSLPHQTAGYFGTSNVPSYRAIPQAVTSGTYQTVFVPDGSGSFVRVQGIPDDQVSHFPVLSSGYNENMGYAGGAGSISSPPFPGRPVSVFDETKASVNSRIQEPVMESTSRPVLSPMRKNERLEKRGKRSQH